MRVAGLGRTSWLYESLVAVADAGHQVTLIGTCEASPEYSRREEDFADLARRLGCPFFCKADLGSEPIAGMLAASESEIAISMNWATLVRSSSREHFPRGILNAHAGDLPRYRGNAAPNWAILNGETEVVVTIHRMVDELDAGPVYLERSTPITEDTYIRDVYDFIEANVPEMFVEVLAGIEAGTLEPRQQPSDPATWMRCLPRRPEDGALIWSRPATELARLVRASAEPFAGAFTELEGRRLRVWRAHARPLPFPHCGIVGQIVSRSSASGQVSVLTGDGLLVLEEVQREEGPRCNAAEVVRSTRQRLS